MPGSILETLFARRWIAGPTIDDAVSDAKKFNRNGVGVILNYLGEEYREKEAVDDTVETYLSLIKEIKSKRLKADISTKPTELGDLISKKLLFQNYSRIVDFAAKKKVFVWLDMEESQFVSDTIALYKSKVKTGNTGICIQSYLKRSINDLKHLPRNSTVRLVKGAYTGPNRIAFPKRAETTSNYFILMDYLFAHFKRFTIGTHDARILQEALKLDKRYRRDVTYAMLKGIRNDYAYQFAKKGEKVAVYVPFGKEWVRYAYRRLKEMSNLKLFLRSLFGG